MAKQHQQHHQTDIEQMTDTPNHDQLMAFGTIVSGDSLTLRPLTLPAVEAKAKTTLHQHQTPAGRPDGKSHQFS